MEEFDDKLRRHLDQLLAHQENNPDRPLSLKEMKELAWSMGTTDKEWDLLMQKAETILRLAEDHLIHQNFKDAVKLAEQATAINPYITGGYGVLAHARLLQFVHDGDEEHKVNAEKAANEALKLNPKDRKALKVLGSLRQQDRAGGKSGKMMKNMAIIGGAVILVVVVMVFMFKGGASPTGAGTASIDAGDSESIRFGFIDAEEACNEAWAQVQNQLTRRDNVVPKMMAMISNPGSDIEAIQAEIERLSSELSGLDEKDEAYGKTQAALQVKLAGLVEGVSSQGASNDATEFQYLIIEMEGAENRISVERKRYNSKVKEYNTFVKKYGAKFPDYELIPYFEAK
jgi:hypothetical protein